MYSISLQILDSTSDESTETLEARAADAIARTETDHPDSYDKVPQPKSVIFTEHDNPFSLVDSSGAPHIATLSSNAWVGCGDDVYVLECLGKGYIRIDPVPADDGGFTNIQAILDSF